MLKNIRLSCLFLALVTLSTLASAQQIIKSQGPLDPASSAAACRDWYAPLGVTGTYCYYIGFNIPDSAKPTVENGMYYDLMAVTIAGQVQTNPTDGNILAEYAPGSAIPNFGTVIPVSIPDAQKAKYTTYSDTITKLKDADGNVIQITGNCQVSIDISKDLPNQPKSWCAKVLNIYFSTDGKSARCVQSNLACIMPNK